MATRKRAKGIGGRMEDFQFKITDPDGNSTVITGDDEPVAQEQPAPAAAEEPDSEGIDWANVASEAAAMLELNKDATSSWQGQQSEPEEG